MKTSLSLVINLSSRVLITRLSIFAGFFLARYLGPEKYGILGVYVTLLGFIPAVGSFGLIDSLGVKISKEGLSSKLYSSGMFIIVGLSALMVVLFVLFRQPIVTLLNLDFTSDIFIILLVHLFIYFINLYQEKVLEATYKSHIFSIVQILFVLFRLIAVFSIIYFRLPLVYVVLLELAITFGYLVSYYLYMRRVQKLKIEFSLPEKQFVNKLFKYGLSLYIAAMFFLLSQRLPILVVQSLYGPEYVSFLNVPLNFISRLFLPVLAIANVVAPMFGRITQKSSQHFNDSVKMLLIIYVPISVLFVSQSTQIITMFYGKEYAPAGSTLAALSVFTVFSAVNTFLTCVIQYLGLSSSRIRNILVIALINLVLFVLGIKFIGFESIAVVMSFIIFVLTLLDIKLLSKTLEINFARIAKEFGLILIASTPIYLLTAGISNLDHGRFIILGSVSAVIYLAFVLGFKVLRKSDILTFVNSLKKSKNVE